MLLFSCMRVGAAISNVKRYMFTVNVMDRVRQSNKWVTFVIY